MNRTSSKPNGAREARGPEDLPSLPTLRRPGRRALNLNLAARLLSLLLLAPLAGCGIPNDPEQTLEHVRGGTLRVGAVDNPPFVIVDDRQIGGSEADLVRGWAGELNAKLEWHRGSEDDLMDQLDHYELDLVIGGITDATPWKKKVGLTRPYQHTPGRRQVNRHVLALPPGENAWLRWVEEALWRRFG